MSYAVQVRCEIIWNRKIAARPYFVRVLMGCRAAICTSRGRDDVTDPSIAPNSLLEARGALSEHKGAER